MPVRRVLEPAPVETSLLNAYWTNDALCLVSRGIGKARTRIVRPSFDCFLRTAEVDDVTLRNLRGSRYVLGMCEEGSHLRISWRDGYARRSACMPEGWFASRGITALEGDVDPVRRYLTDHPTVTISRPHRAYLDLEADSRVPFAEMERARMLAWALADDSGAIVASAVLSEDSDDAEGAMLVELWRELDAYDQVVSWNGDRYDFPLLFARSKRRRIAVEPRRWLWLDHLPLFRKMAMNAAESGDEKQSLALDAVAKSVVGVGKMEGVSGADSWNLWQSDPAKLLLYCEHDTRLMPMIEQKTGYCELLQTLCEATTCFADSAGCAPTRQVEGFLLRLGAERDIRFATHFYDETRVRAKYEGAYVMEPSRKGIVRGVHVCDFARLYPSVIMSFNLSPETVRGRRPKPGARPSYLAHEAAEGQAPNGCAVVPLTEVVVAQEPRGVLPVALEELLRLRKEWGKKKNALPPGTPEWKEADRRDAAYKIAANSFYGVVGSPFSRFYVRDVAESTSLGGVWLIKATTAAARAQGIEVIYGDTDSDMAIGCTDERFREFVAWCNAELYPKLLKERGCTRNSVSLEYEKKFRRAVFVSKKRYAASYEMFKGAPARADSKLEVKGLEYKRGDTALLARRMQLEVIELMLRQDIEDPKEYAALLDARMARVLDLEQSLSVEEASISKRLTKTLGAYVRKPKKDGSPGTQAAHVEVATVLEERGETVQKGTKVAYVVVDGSVSPARALPASDYTGDVDRHYLWEQLIFPPTQRVLQAAFPTDDWTKWARTRLPKPRRPRSAFVHPNQLKLFEV